MDAQRQRELECLYLSMYTSVACRNIQALKRLQRSLGILPADSRNERTELLIAALRTCRDKLVAKDEVVILRIPNPFSVYPPIRVVP